MVGNAPRDRWQGTEVRCLSGYKANERPLSFKREDGEVSVVAVPASYRDPDHLYFKVEGDDGSLYILRHHEYLDTWHVTEAKNAFRSDPLGV